MVFSGILTFSKKESHALEPKYPFLSHKPTQFSPSKTSITTSSDSFTSTFSVGSLVEGLEDSSTLLETADFWITGWAIMEK